MGTRRRRLWGIWSKEQYGQIRKRRPPDHVVVFVHGMGRALKGGTLQEWAQPLAQSLCDLALDETRESGHAPLIIDRANAVGDAPEMWVQVLRGDKPDGKPDYLTVLMTEASWGADFAPATAIDTYWWAWSMLNTVFDRSAYLIRWNLYPGKRNWRSPLWIAKAFGELLLWFLAVAVGFVLVFPLLLILLVVVILERVPGLGRAVSAFVSLFADFLGDPQVWKRRPLQAAAMRQRIRDTLERWDHTAHIPVTVVAHSQGAAVAGQVLFQPQENHRSRATNFVTVGSGLALLGYARWGGPGDDPVQDWLNRPDTRWINIWGKFDFVPAGPISTRENGENPVFKEIYNPDRWKGKEKKGNPGPGPEEHPVYNRSALIKDHIVYSQNRIEVIDPIARLIYPSKATSADLWLGGAQGDTRLRPHRVMVKSMGVTRPLALIAGVVLAPEILSILEFIGWVRSRFQWASADDWPVLAVAAALIAAVLIGILNGPLWTMLHGRVERRYKEPTTSRFKTPRDPRKSKDVSEDGRWSNVVCYLVITYAVAVCIPSAILLRDGLPWWSIGYLGGALLLFALCFTGTRISPLPARLKAQPPVRLKAEPDDG